MNAEAKLARLQSIIRDTGGMLVAFSGGVDSTFLARVASEVLGDRALAVTVRSVIHAQFELKDAIRLAQAIGIRHRVVTAEPLQIEGFAHNSPERCYICKRELLARLREIAKEEGLPAVAEGSNADDSVDYRPGTRAVREMGVRSPLLEAGLTKAEIRTLSCAMGLATWDRPSYACLASRVPYGEEITEDKLRRIDGAEEILREKGYKVFRVRHHGDVARIELSADDMRRFLAREDLSEVARSMKALGFRYVALDLEGYRLGSLNEALGRVRDAGQEAPP